MSESRSTSQIGPAALPHKPVDVALWFAAIVAAVAIIVLSACSSGAGAGPAAASQAATESSDGLIISATGEYAAGKHHVRITVKDYGTIELELDADAAPISTSNFCQLASDGFYDGLTFHRIISGFMIQGGDPQGNGTGGSDR